MARSVLFYLSIQAMCVIMFTHGKHLQTEDQQFIDSLQQYEFVEPHMGEPFTVQSINRDSKTAVKEKRLLSFQFQGQIIKILLTLNSNLLSPNFLERYVTKHGYEIVKEAPRKCYFHGHVEGKQNTSIAAISSCNGFEGYFALNGTAFSIEPVKSLTGEVFHIVFESEQVNLPKYKCGFRENIASEIFTESVLQEKHRVRRNVLSETKYVELVVVNDHTQGGEGYDIPWCFGGYLCAAKMARFYSFSKHGSDTSTRAIAAANFADSTYRAQNIRVVLTMIEIWKDMDEIVSSTDNNKYLSNFIEYKKKILDRNETTKSDHAVLITQRPLQNGRHGWAYTGTICSPRSASLVYNKYGTSIFGSIMAHELGHSFGFNHIKADCSCGDTSRLKCLMNSAVSYSPLKWSNCTATKLKSILQSNYGTCLFNQPKKHYFKATCQNGFIDHGEECDCGTKEECEQRGTICCNYTTCKLYPQSECDTGPCCHNCKIKPRGSVCREKVNDCDLPEYCDGKSEICAPDSYVHNGRACSVKQGKSLCYLGVCHTHDKQCKLYWGEDAFHSEVCYTKLNVAGNVLGFCKLLDANKYMKCEKKDVLCGKLQCKVNEGGRRTPLSGGSSLFARFGSHTCWSGHLTYPTDPSIGMVETGSMCAENKVCSNNTCMDVNEVYEQPECSNNCSGNGICNNLGHCHCNPGYGCPNCSEKCDSDGGSVDSGGNCYCSGPTTIPKTTETGKTTREQTTHETTQVSTEPSTTHKGNSDKNKESKEVVKIVVPVIVVLLFLIILIVCYIFRAQILERLRKSTTSRKLSLKKSKCDDHHVTFSNREVRPSTTAELENPENNSLSFTSICSIVESKIDDNREPGDTSTSSPIHDVPSAHSNYQSPTLSATA